MKVINNPFYILKCMPDNTKAEIHEQAEIRSFEIDENVCKKSENILINPKKRLEAEISWFPGFDLKTFNERKNLVTQNFKKYISDLFFLKTKKNLAEANMLAFGFESVDDLSDWSNDDVRMAAGFICSFSEKITVEDTKETITLDREKSKFPSVLLEEDLENLIQQQKEYYEEVLYNIFQKMKSENCIEILTKMIEEATDSGQNVCKWALLDSIINKYEGDLSDFFNEQDSIINEDLDMIKEGILPYKNEIISLDEAYNTLESDLNYWKRVVKPIMILKKCRGLSYEYGEDMFFKIRELALLSSNKYKNYSFSLKLTKLCEIIFAEMRQVMEIVRKDSSDLRFLFEEAENTAADNRNFMLYHCECAGLIKKTPVDIDQNSISVGNQEYPFDSIVKIKWSYTINQKGLISETIRIIQFLTNKMLVPVTIKPTDDTTYNEIISRLSVGAGSLIMKNIIKDLKNCKVVKIGNIVLYDYGMELKDEGFFISEVKLFCWKDIKSVSIENGALIVVGPGNFKLKAELGSDYNIVILTELLSRFFNLGKGTRLSDFEDSIT